MSFREPAHVDTKTAMRQLLNSMRSFAYLIGEEDRAILKSLILNDYAKNNVDGLHAIVKHLNKIARTTGSSFQLYTVNNGCEYDYRETRF